MTSRLMRNVATALLYRTVSLSNVPQIKAFLRTMKQRSSLSSPLSRHIRRFSITDDEKHDLKLSPTIVKAITSIFSQLSNLRFLELLIDEAIEFTDMLQHAYFPNLTSFEYTIEPQTSALLPLFLNRHPTLDDLTLAQRHPIERLDPAHLPNLKCYSGPACFVPSLTLDRGCISWVCLMWYQRDLNVELPLLHLGRTISPRSIIAIFPCDVLTESTILGGVGNTPISHAETLEIAAHLKKFSCLSTLDVFWG
ncbi:hypothetical protein B0H14DRAFT_3757000 [Mycena olivaceomarginata]|nr:hypothetical protein B0H14DRAFT_3757000 [Mycena olivaceomarginata]